MTVNKRRVVVTGLGTVCPVGNDVDTMWENIKNGVCGIDEITHFDTTDFKVKLAGEIKDLNIEDYINKKEAKRLDRFSQLALIAAKQAYEDSKINMDEIEAKRKKESKRDMNVYHHFLSQWLLEIWLPEMLLLC